MIVLKFFKFYGYKYIIVNSVRKVGNIEQSTLMFLDALCFARPPNVDANLQVASVLRPYRHRFGDGPVRSITARLDGLRRDG